MPSTNGHGPKRAILYARVSTDEQARSGYSLAQQLEALRAHCEREGYEVLEEVSDPGQSGASLERPGMDRVRDLVAVIQCGADNPYGHPTPETLDRLQRTGARVFRNDEHGDVIVTIKDQKVDVAVTKPEAA